MTESEKVTPLLSFRFPSNNRTIQTATPSFSLFAVWKLAAGGIPSWKLSATVGCPPTATS